MGFFGHDTLADLTHKRTHRVNNKKLNSNLNCESCNLIADRFGCRIPWKDCTNSNNQAKVNDLPDENDGDCETVEVDCAPGCSKVEEKGNTVNGNRNPGSNRRSDIVCSVVLARNERCD